MQSYDNCQIPRKVWLKKEMNIAYQILHIEKDITREPLVKENKFYLNKYFKDLNCKTFGIYNKKDLDNYYLGNHGLQIDKDVNFRYAEIGCWASHYSAWKTFYESNYDAVLIFEDDMKILEGFYEDLMLNIKFLPEGWDAFFAHVPIGNFSYYIPEQHNMEGNPRICKTYQGNWLGGYLISKSGAKKLLDSAKTPMGRPVDIHIFYSPGMLNSYSIRPWSASYIQGIDLGTTIHEVERVY